MRLTKREIVMLVLLIIIALTFVEFRYVITPGLDRYYDLLDQNDALAVKVDEIRMNLAAAPNNQKRIDENLVSIEDLSKNYLPTIKVDQLIVFTHELMQRNGFLPTSYIISPVQISLVTPSTVNLTDLVYQIKTLSKQFELYNEEIANPVTESTEPDALPTDAEPVINDQLEHFSMTVSATATYDQILLLLDDMHSYQKSVLISAFTMNPTIDNTLSVELTLNYYGVEKLIETANLNDSEFLDWKRIPYMGHESDPFAYPIPTDVSGETIEGTTGTLETTETTGKAP